MSTYNAIKKPTRYINGVGTSTKQSALGAFGLPDRLQYVLEENDWFTYTAADWTVTETSAGGAQAIADGDGGIMVLTNTANNNFVNQLQRAKLNWYFTAGKPMFFKARVKVSDATNCAMYIGLQNVNSGDPTAATDGVYFVKASGAKTVNFVVAASSTATTASAVATMADDTYVQLAFWYDGKESICYYVDDVAIGHSVTTNMPSAGLSLMMAIKNGAAAVKSMSIDYYMVAKQR